MSNDDFTWPSIPGEKLYFNIKETARLCCVLPHVLRYWEREFPLLRPTKGRGGRRYYQLKDIQLVREIRNLLYQKRFTIQGARQHLRDNRLRDPIDSRASPLSIRQVVVNVLHDLERLRDYLRK